MADASRGRVITFYSYKGGTGRSMALANVAWILASNGKRVLIIDWDLEAPGLHRYFSPFLKDKELTSTEGLIDFVVDFASEAMTAPDDPEAPPDPNWYLPFANIRRYAQSLDWKFKEPGLIDFVPAGRQGPDYATAVNSFNWKAFYERHNGGAFLEATRKAMVRDYDFVLVDSRTGVSDTSGICTIQMPDDVVVCFTLNRQSISGAAAAACSVAAQRESDGSGRALRVFPVPMRVDKSEKDKLAWARAEAHEKFDELLKSHMRDEGRRKTYWNEIEVLYEAYYAYEEVLAVFADRFKEKASMLKAMELLSGYVTDIHELRAEPKEISDRIVLAYSRQPKIAVADTAETAPAAAALDGLTAGDQAVAVRVLARFIHYGSESSGDVPRNVALTEMADLSQRKLAQDLLNAGVLRAGSPGDENVMALADPNVIRDWQPLTSYISENRSFLRWRQELAEKARSWQRKEPGAAFLGFGAWRLARLWRRIYPADFAEAEKKYVAASFRRLVRNAASAAIVGAAVAVALLLWQRSLFHLFRELLKDAPVAAVVSTNSSDRAEAIAAWAKGLFLYGQPEAANDALQTLPDPGLRVQADINYAALLDSVGQSASAKKVLQSALSDAQKDKADSVLDIDQIASVYADAGDLGTARKLWTSAITAAFQLPDGAIRLFSLRSVCLSLQANNQFDLATQAMQREANETAIPTLKSDALSFLKHIESHRVVSQTPKTEKDCQERAGDYGQEVCFAKLGQIAKAATLCGDYSVCWTEISNVAIAQGKTKDLLQAATGQAAAIKIQVKAVIAAATKNQSLAAQARSDALTLPGYTRFSGLEEVAQTYQQLGNSAEAISTWEAALATIPSLDFDSQTSEFAVIAKGFADAHDYHKAFDVANGITRPPSKLTAYGNILAARGLETHPKYAKALAASQKKSGS